MKKCVTVLILFGILIGLAGCGSEEVEKSRVESETKFSRVETENEDTNVTEVEEKDSEGNETQEQQEVMKGTSSNTEKVLDAFINNEIPLADNQTTYFKDMMQEEGAELGERIDLDNDGENELIITNYYGGYYLDVRDDKVWKFAQGEGTADMLHYVEYDGAIWIYHSDTTHAGRQTYYFEKYKGGDNLVDSFDLKDEYWDDVNHVYTYRGKETTKEEYDRIFGEIFGNGDTEVVNEKSDIESNIQNIKEIYYSIQNNLSSYKVCNPGYLLTSYLDKDGHCRKLIAQNGAYQEGIIGDATEAIENYTAEYYYDYKDVSELIFVFVYDEDEEYRYYVKDGKCIRYIDTNGVITDYPEGAAVGTIAHTDCFISTGIMEIHWASPGPEE